MKNILCQFAAVVILSIPSFLAATSITWTSYTQQILESASSPLGVAATRSQMSMIASFPMLGSLVTAATCWRVPDLMGRKNTERLVGLFLILAWSLIATAYSPTQVIAARFIVGIGVGLHLLIFVVYINELVQSFIRGTMACVPLFFFAMGGLVSYLMGWFCSYNFVVYANLVGSVVFGIGINFLKESPVFLVTKRKDAEALKSLKFYRGTSKTTAAIIEELEYFKKQRDGSNDSDEKGEATEKVKLNKEDEELANVSEMSPWRMLLTTKPSQRALVTVTSLCCLSMMMGMMALQTYAGHFFALAAPGISPHLCAVVMAVVIAAGNALAVFITDLVPRRVLMLSSCATCSVSLAVLVTMLRWGWAPAWAVPIPMLVFTFAYTVGAGNLPVVQMSESFCPQVRMLASAVFMSGTFGCNFLVISFFGPAVDLFGLDGTFLFFLLITITITILSYFIMKETRGIPLEQIQGMYGRGYLYWK